MRSPHKCTIFFQTTFIFLSVITDQFINDGNKFKYQNYTRLESIIREKL